MNKNGVSRGVRTLWNLTSTLILLVVASGGGLLYEVLYRFGDHEALAKHVVPEEVMIFLISLLCFGLGTERVLTLRKIEDDIEIAQDARTKLIADVHELLTSSAKLRTEIVGDFKAIVKGEKDILSGLNRIVKTEALFGSRQIESAARELISECDDHEKIKATGQYRAGDGLSLAYFRHLAERVARAKKNEGSMEYDVAVASVEGGAPSNDDARMKAFHEAGLDDRLNMRIVKHPWPFEVLIGGHSIIIALLSGDSTSKYEAAVKITDPGFVEDAADWFRDVVWASAEKPKRPEITLREGT